MHSLYKGGPGVRKYWLITQEAMAPSQHDWKIVDWDVKPQHNNNLPLKILENLEYRKSHLPHFWGLFFNFLFFINQFSLFFSAIL